MRRATGKPMHTSVDSAVDNAVRLTNRFSQTEAVTAPCPKAGAHIGYRVGSVMYWRPAGVVQRKSPEGNCSAFHRGCCLSLWSYRHFGLSSHTHQVRGALLAVDFSAASSPRFR